MAKGIHTEQTFEEAIVSSLLENGGYVQGNSTDFDANQGLFPSYIIQFLKDSHVHAKPNSEHRKYLLLPNRNVSH